MSHWDFLQDTSGERNGHYQEVEEHTYSRYALKHTPTLLSPHTHTYCRVAVSEPQSFPFRHRHISLVSGIQTLSTSRTSFNVVLDI